MLYEAGFINFFRTIIIIVLIYYTFKLFAKYVAPYLLKRWMEKKMKDFNGRNYQQFNQKRQDQFNQTKEGEVKIKHKKRNNKNNDNIGEYVDYEEVD